jgi:hypothetical protein
MVEPGNARIIGRRLGEVNGASDVRAHAPRLVVLSWLVCILCAACGGRETKAEADLEAARVLFQEKKVTEAVAALRDLIATYPDTDSGRLAQKDLQLYQGLLDAARLDRLRRARATLVLAARALDRSRRAQGRWPDRLDQLVPRQLMEVPLDPWDRPLAYARLGAGYRRASYGADASPGGEGEDRDLVVESGAFVEDVPEAR